MKPGAFSGKQEGTAAGFQRQARLAALMERDGRRCRHCNRSVRPVRVKQGARQPKDMATEDHILTRAQGGGDEMDNLLLACFECNNRRGQKPLAEFTALLAYQARAR